MKILATGFPRSGTQWFANAFEMNGLRVGHERWHPNGGVGYMFARAEERTRVVEADIVVHLVRDPRKAIASAMKNINRYTSLVKDFDEDWQDAYVYWNILAEAATLYARTLGKPARRITIEHSIPWVYDVLLRAGIEIEYDDMVLPSPTHNHKQDYPPLGWKDLKPEVIRLARRYGYLKGEQNEVDYRCCDVESDLR